MKVSRANVPDPWTVYDSLGNRVATKINGVWRYLVYDAFGEMRGGGQGRRYSMSLISTTMALSFPFAAICWWVYIFRHAKSPLSFVGSIIGVTAVAVSSLVPIAEIVFTRQILSLRPSVW